MEKYIATELILTVVKNDYEKGEIPETEEETFIGDKYECDTIDELLENIFKEYRMEKSNAVVMDNRIIASRLSEYYVHRELSERDSKTEGRQT